MMPMTTWKKPNLSKQDKWKQQPEETDRTQWGNKTGKNTSPHGQAQMGKQTDKLTIL